MLFSQLLLAEAAAGGDFTPLSPQAQVAVVSLLAIGLIVLNILSFFKRKPPLDSELVRLSSSIESLQKSVGSLDHIAKDHASHSSQIEDLRENVKGLEAQREKDLHAQRTYTRETTREIFDAVDELKTSFNSNIQSIERGLGKLEGSVDGIDSRVGRLETNEGRA